MVVEIDDTRRKELAPSNYVRTPQPPVRGLWPGQVQEGGSAATWLEVCVVAHFHYVGNETGAEMEKKIMRASVEEEIVYSLG